MRKFILFAVAVFFTIGAQAASYGILVNNSKYFEAAALGDKDHQGRDQYKASVSLNVGDVFCVYDKDNSAKFTIAMEAGDGSAKGKFTEGAESATCNEAGCYDFYIKLKWEDNSMWVQAGTECNATGEDLTPGEGGGGEGGGGGQGGGSGEDHYYYYKGYVDGADIEGYMEGVNGFVKGIASFSCSQKSYLFVVYQVHGVPGVEYASDKYVEESETHHCTLKTNPSPFEKMGFEPGDYTLYLYDNGDGTLELSTIQLEGKTLVDANGEGGGEEEAIDNLNTNASILNTNEPMFDLLGRKVTEEYHGVVIQNGHKFIR